MSTPHRGPHDRRVIRAGYALIAGLLFTATGATVWLVATGPKDAGPPVIASPAPAHSADTSKDLLLAPRSGPHLLDVATDEPGLPTTVRIPSLGVVSSLDRLGMNSHGVLESPPRPQVAAWFAGGPRPGEVGSAVLAGHARSPAGPGVFAGLAALRPGHQIAIDDRDGTTRVFAVSGIDHTTRAEFPTEILREPTLGSELLLISCDGARHSQPGSQVMVIVRAAEMGPLPQSR